jgi:hypothetical protein
MENNYNNNKDAGIGIGGGEYALQIAHQQQHQERVLV